VDLGKRNSWRSQQVPPHFVRAVKQAARNVRCLAERQLPKPWTIEVESGVKISQVVRPIESIGCYIPGGHFSLVSTLIMTVVPAMSPAYPRLKSFARGRTPRFFQPLPSLGSSASLAIGGAQAIAALAYGTESIPRVEKLFGPGNKYVTAAKQLVSGDCAIDLPAGPTEAIVFCDNGNARWIAADLLAQAQQRDACKLIVTLNQRALATCAKRSAAIQRALPLSQKTIASVGPAGKSIAQSPLTSCLRR